MTAMTANDSAKRPSLSWLNLFSGKALRIAVTAMTAAASLMPYEAKRDKETGRRNGIGQEK